MQLAQRYALTLRGEYASAGLLPPVSGPSVYRRLARVVLDAHGLDPLGDAESLARAEGLYVAWGWTPGRHGIHYDDTIVISPAGDAAERALAVHHERAHAHFRRLGAPHHTEADVVWFTTELAFPSWLRRREPPKIPSWLISLLT